MTYGDKVMGLSNQSCRQMGASNLWAALLGAITAMKTALYMVISGVLYD